MDMGKYNCILITVIEMKILIEKFNDYSSAYNKMEEEFYKYGGDKELITDGTASLDCFEAHLEDGNNHDNYSWRIVSI